MSSAYKLILSSFKDLSKNEFIDIFRNLVLSEQEFLIKKIQNDKFSPFFLNYLKEKKLENFFEDNELKHLKNQKYRLQFQSLEIVKEVLFLNDLFNEKKLNPIYLKGVSLMGEYSDPSLRPAVDIDILFENDELFEANDLLKKNNYSGLFKGLSDKDLSRYLKNKNHLPHLRRETNITIELHNRLTNPADFRKCPITNQVFDNKKLVNFYNTKIFTPSIDDIIVHQLVHFSINSDFFNQLRTFSDIYQIEKNYKIDWIKIFSKNKNIKIRKAMALSLEVLNFDLELTNGFYNLRKKYKDYFPPKELILSSHKKTFGLEKTNFGIEKQSLYNLIKAQNFFEILKIVFKRILPNKFQVIEHFKISRPNYFKLIFFGFLILIMRFVTYGPKIFSFLIKKNTNSKNLNDLKKLKDWIDC